MVIGKTLEVDNVVKTQEEGNGVLEETHVPNMYESLILFTKQFVWKWNNTHVNEKFEYAIATDVVDEMITHNL